MVALYFRLTLAILISIRRHRRRHQKMLSYSIEGCDRRSRLLASWRNLRPLFLLSLRTDNAD